MDQNFQDSFRNRVFDQATFDLFLEIMQFLESCKDSESLARRISLDSFAFNDSIEKSIQFFNTLNAFKSPDIQNNLENIVKAVPLFEELSEELSKAFLLTLRALATSETPVDLGLFFKALHLIYKANSELVDSFLKTVRQLPAAMRDGGAGTFSQFFISHFESQSRLDLFLEAIRHSSGYFVKEESFLNIFKALSQVKSEHAFDAFSLGQLESKKWLLDEAEKAIGGNWGRVFVLAGWMGVLPRMIFDRDSIQTVMVRNFDLDPVATEFSEVLNFSEVVKKWKFKSLCIDVRLLDYPITRYALQKNDGTFSKILHESPDLIINTSCEHMEDIGSWFEGLPHGLNLILQSNDAFGLRDHHGCVESLEDFKRQLPLKKIFYEGTLDLGDYRRFMLIGQK